MSSATIFIFVAMTLGIIIEGLFQICINAYYFETDKNKIFKDQSKTKYTIRGNCLNFLVAKSTIQYVCEYLSEKNENHMKMFIEDYKRMNTPCPDLYGTVHMCAKVIEKNGINVYRFRDISFIMQLMRMPFLFIFVTSILSWACCYIKLYGTEHFCSFAIFIALSLIISSVFIFIIPIMSRAIGRRYLFEVERAYEALRFVLLNQKEISPARLDE